MLSEPVCSSLSWASSFCFFPAPKQMETAHAKWSSGVWCVCVCACACACGNIVFICEIVIVTLLGLCVMYRYTPQPLIHIFNLVAWPSGVGGCVCLWVCACVCVCVRVRACVRACVCVCKSMVQMDKMTTRTISIYYWKNRGKVRGLIYTNEL